MNTFKPTRSIPRRTRSLAGALAIAALIVSAGCSEDLTDADYVARAQTSLQAGDLNTTAIELKNALRINPMNPNARFLLGQTYFALGDGDSSEKEMRRALEMGIPESDVLLPLAGAVLLAGNYTGLLEEFQVDQSMSKEDQASLMGLRGMASLRLADLASAQTYFSTALELNPGEATATLGQAFVQRNLGNAEEAAQWLEKAMAIDARQPEAWSLRGDLLALEGDREGAENAYGQAINFSRTPAKYLLQRALLRIDLRKYPEARQDIRRLPAQLPGKYYATGLIELQQRELLRAQGSFEAALTKYEDYPPAQYYLGLTHTLLGNDEQAQLYLRQFLAQVPESVTASNLLARLQIRQGDLASAQALLDPIFKENPDQQETLDLMAGLELIQGNQKDALARYRKLLAQNPASASAHSKLGVAMILSGDIEEGTAAMEKAIELAPEDEKLELKLVQAQIKAGEPERAIQAERQWIERKPQSVNARLALAWSQLNSNQTEAARQSFGAVLDLDPGNPSASHNLAVFALYGGDLKAAIAYYEQSQMFYQGHPRTTVSLARLYNEVGDIDKAIQVLENSRETYPQFIDSGTMLAQIRLENGDPERALDDISELHKSYPENPGVLAVLGAARAANGKYNQAISAYEQLESLSSLSARNHYLLAKAYYETGDVRRFSETLAAAYEAHPDNYTIQIAMAGLVIAQGKTVEAREIVTRLENQYPGQADVYDQAAKLARLEQKPEREVAALGKMLELQPEDSSVAIKYALALWRAREFDAAYAHLETWMTARPDDQLVQYNLANLYLLGGREEQAIAAFEVRVETHPNDTPAINNLAWLLRERDPRRALTLAEEAHRQAPDAAPVQDTLAMILLQSPGQEERAVALLRRATEAAPGRTDFQYHLAVALAQAGQNRQAARVLSSLLNASPEFSDREAAQALLAQLAE
ncbi:MAG: PEP-CTERM system TPR-repeat protein PrsT [Gammaproteobacteria bacterium]|nr:PEP-CTERM system TPR-repeat protein PrsT [Gammaproteobacteria bacterium]